MHARRSILRVPGSRKVSLRGSLAAAVLLPALLVSVVPAVPAAAVSAGGAPRTVASDTEEAATAVFAPDASGVSRPGETLTISGTLTNTGSTPLTAGRVSLSVGRDVADSTALRSAWGDASSLETRDLVTIDAPPLAVGGSVQLSAIIPAEVMDGALDGTGWGAHVVLAHYTSGAATASSASALVRLQGDGPAPLPVSVVLPMVASANTDGLIPAEQLELLTAADGELASRLQTAAADPDVTIALDPRLVASVRVLGTAAPASATTWLRRLELLPNQVFPLQYGDADPGLQVNAGLGTLLAPTNFAAALDASRFPDASNPAVTATPGTTATPSPSPTGGPTLPTTAEILEFPYTRTDLAWPAAGTLSDDTLSRLAAAGLPTTIVDADQLLGATGASATVGDRTVLVDGSASEAVSEAYYALGSAEGRLQTSRAAALIASAAQQGGTTSVLAALDRDEEAGTSSASRLDALLSLPWVSRATVPGTSAQPVAATLVPGQDFRVSGFQSLLDDESRIGSFSSVLQTPELLTGSSRLELMATIRAGGSSRPDAWDRLVSLQTQRTAQTLDAVSIDASSQINVVAYSAGVPVNITNALPYPVTVNVLPRASNGRLTISSKIVTVDPESTGRFFLDAKSIANGRAGIELQMVSPTGVPIGAARQLQVELSPFVETAGIAVLGALVLGLLGFGTYRSIRRGRRARAEQTA